jgi:hypothetical protein
LGFAFVASNGPYINSSVPMAVKTSFQLDHQHSDKMDDIVAKPLNVKFDFRIDRNPCFAAVKFTENCKIKVVVLFDYEN